MKFGIKEIVEYIKGMIDKYLYQTIVGLAAKGVTGIISNIPVLNVYMYLRKIMSWLGLAPDLEKKIEGYITKFIMNYVMKQQAAAAGA